MTDAAILTEIGERIARHRLERNWTQAQLAKEAGISQRTLVRLEAGSSTQLTNFIRVLRTLELLNGLDAFIPPDAPSPLEQLQNEGKRRQRASSRPESTEADPGWSWGDENSEASRRADRETDS